MNFELLNFELEKMNFEFVKNELENALTQHELVKIRLPAIAKADKKHALTDLCAATAAIEIQIIGRIGVVYRPLQS